MSLVAFALVAGPVCLLAAARERLARRLLWAERRWHDLDQCLVAAQHLKRFWIWELDYRHMLWHWTDPYGLLRAKKYEHVESWLSHVHPEDRVRCRKTLALAAERGMLTMEFRVYTSSGLIRVLAKGLVPDERERGSRLIGVSVELEPAAGDFAKHKRNYLRY